jgi:AraC-like DNA-binding protein
MSRKADIRYFFVVPPIQNKELTIRGIGIREIMPPCIVNRPKGTGDILIMFFHDDVVLRCKNGVKEFSPNTLMVWHNGAGHYYGNETKSWLHSWVHCKGGLVEYAIKKGRLSFDVPISGISADMFEKYLYDLHFELTASLKPCKEIAGNILLNMMLEVARLRKFHNDRSAISQVPQRLQKIFYILLASPEKEIRLKELADLAGYSVPRFCAVFKKYFFVSPIEHLIQSRIVRAKELLRDRNLSIKEIALKVGYSDICYFSRLFRKRCRMSPCKYRKVSC